MDRAHRDVMVAVRIWSKLLETTFGARLDYAYTKGSALKAWDGYVDYVPVVSDLDIHIMMSDDNLLFSTDRRGFTQAMEVSRQYEDLFLSERPEYLHIPRSQVVHLNPQKDDPNFFLPRKKDIHIMVGHPEEPVLPSTEMIRKDDYNQLESMIPFLDDLPRQVFDRAGLDFWALLRRLNWRVSPAPVRLLTQNASNPFDVWNWNRTQIIKELERQGYNVIAKSYQQFYEMGWKFFLSEFKGFRELREIIVYGHDVVRECLEQARII